MKRSVPEITMLYAVLNLRCGKSKAMVPMYSSAEDGLKFPGIKNLVSTLKLVREDLPEYGD